jgi:hypothetical protein
LTDRGRYPATWPPVQSFMNDVISSLSGRVLAARWLTAAVIRSPPYMSSTETMRFSSCITSRISAAPVIPPARLILMLIEETPAERLAS